MPVIYNLAITVAAFLVVILRNSWTLDWHSAALLLCGIVFLLVDFKIYINHYNYLKSFRLSRRYHPYLVAIFSTLSIMTAILLGLLVEYSEYYDVLILLVVFWLVITVGRAWIIYRKN